MTSTRDRELALALAWAAGFLDGEGCFTLLKHSSSGTHPSQRAVYVGALQTRRAPLDKLVELFGGKATPARPTAKGTPMWQWRIGEARVVERAIALVLPYLIVKKREAEIVSEFAATIRRRGHARPGVSHTTEDEIVVRHRLIEEMNMIRGRSAAEVVMPG